MTASLHTYTDMIDPSTTETLVETLGQAADSARADAARLEERAAELRSNAASLEDKPGMRDAAENIIREAAALEATAELRLGLAAGYESRADDVAAEATA
jgi:hypothetical protein